MTALPCTSGSAASVTTSERAQTTCATSSSAGTVTSTRGRLRNDLISVSSSSLATTTVGASWPQPCSSSTACFVDGASKESPATRPSVPAWAWSLSAARKRGASGLLVHLDREVARRGREGDAAARELRRADRALAGTPGSLLAPRLRAAARDEAAALRGPRALPARVQLRAHGLVHEVRLDLGGEDGLVERDLLLRAAEQGCLRSGH